MSLVIVSFVVFFVFVVWNVSPRPYGGSEGRAIASNLSKYTPTVPFLCIEHLLSPGCSAGTCWKTSKMRKTWKTAPTAPSAYAKNGYVPRYTPHAMQWHSLSTRLRASINLPCAVNLIQTSSINLPQIVLVLTVAFLVYSDVFEKRIVTVHMEK